MDRTEVSMIRNVIKQTRSHVNYIQLNEIKLGNLRSDDVGARFSERRGDRWCWRNPDRCAVPSVDATGLTWRPASGASAWTIRSIRSESRQWPPCNPIYLCG